MLEGMQQAHALLPGTETRAALPTTATSMVVVLTYWLSYEYVRDPRHALEPGNAHHALLRGARHVLNLLEPYLEATQRAHLQALAQVYAPPAG